MGCGQQAVFPAQLAVLYKLRKEQLKQKLDQLTAASTETILGIGSEFGFIWSNFHRWETRTSD